MCVKGATCMHLTQCCWQSSEDKPVGVLKEAHPLHAILLPAIHQTSAMQQCMNITMPMWLLLNHVRVIFLESKMGIIVGQTGNLQWQAVCLRSG